MLEQQSGQKNVAVVFAAQENTDLTEGRGLMRTVALFASAEDAGKAIKGRGVMGAGDGKVVPMRVYQSFDEFWDEQKEKLRSMALAKLSPEERAVLGI